MPIRIARGKEEIVEVARDIEKFFESLPQATGPTNRVVIIYAKEADYDENISVSVSINKRR